MLQRTYSSLKVCFMSVFFCQGVRVISGFFIGLAELLFQRLTSSPAEPHLQALKELFINFWGESWSDHVVAQVLMCGVVSN